jgi:hypothetical protein
MYLYILELRIRSERLQNQLKSYDIHYLSEALFSCSFSIVITNAKSQEP